LAESEEKKETVSEESAAYEAEETGAEPLRSDTELQLKEALEKQEKIANEAQNRVLRTLADLENYKKRTQKERIEQIKFANERLFHETLPVIDNLERAILHSTETSDFEKMLEGVVMTHKQLLSVLEKFGVRPIDSLNQIFDPNRHQSVGQVEIEEGSDVKEDQVVNEAQKGYFFNDRVLRPSLVIVAKKRKLSIDEEKEDDVSQDIDGTVETST